MKKGENGYEIITSGHKGRFIVRSYYKDSVNTFEFSMAAHTLHDVLMWIQQHSTALYATTLEETLAMGERMLAPDAFKAAHVMAGQACLYVLRVAADFGHRLFTFEELYAQCPMLSETAARKAMYIGTKEGVFVRVRDDAWRLRKMSRLAARYENQHMS